MPIDGKQPPLTDLKLEPSEKLDMVEVLERNMYFSQILYFAVFLYFIIVSTNIRYSSISLFLFFSVHICHLMANNIDCQVPDLELEPSKKNFTRVNYKTGISASLKLCIFPICWKIDFPPSIDISGFAKALLRPN